MNKNNTSNHPRGIDRGLTNYGDKDFARYLRRSFARSMGYTDAMLDRPVVGIAYTASGFNNCHRHFPEMLEAVKRGVLAGRCPADPVSDDLAGRSLPLADQPQVPQPDGARHRGNDPRPADGCGRADGRLRQDACRRN